MNIIKKIMSNYSVVILKIVALLQIVPLIIAGLNMFPAVDDYSNANRVLATGISNSFVNALHITQNVYLTWQGTYFSCFLLYFLTPLTRGGILATRIACIFAIVFLVSGMFYLCRVLVKDLVNEEQKNIFWFIYVTSIFLFTIGSYVDEAFYWFTGTYVYTVPMACAIWGFAFLIKYRMYGRCGNLIASICMLFCAVGGALQITTLTCGLLLGIVIIDIKDIKKHWYSLIAFGTALIGGVINVMAPGYYIRHEQSSGEFQIKEALFFSVKSVIRALDLMLHSFPFILAIIILFVIGFVWGKKEKLKIEIEKLIITALFLIVGVVVVDFPVYMGYGDYFPGRCLFIENVAVSIMVMILTIMLGSYLSKYQEFFTDKKKIVRMLVVGMVLINILRWNIVLINYPTLNIWRHVLDGGIATYVEISENMFRQLEAGEGTDVIIKELPDCMDIFHGIGLNPSSNFWTNQSIANYYSINSISLE